MKRAALAIAALLVAAAPAQATGRPAARIGDGAQLSPSSGPNPPTGQYIVWVNSADGSFRGRHPDGSDDNFTAGGGGGGGGGGYDTVVDGINGSLPHRNVLYSDGTMLTCADDPANTRTVCTLGASVGTVQSVGLSMPGVFSVAGSPITSSGTFAVTLATQSANTVWCGPSSGGPATPTFRSLVAGDIPSLPESQITSLVSDLASKAADASVLHLAGSPETITVQKTFNVSGVNTDTLFEVDAIGQGTPAAGTIGITAFNATPATAILDQNGIFYRSLGAYYSAGSSHGLEYDWGTLADGSTGHFALFYGGGTKIWTVDATGAQKWFADADANTHKIHNVVNPSSAQDAATKIYVDTAVGTAVQSVSGTPPIASTGGLNPVISLNIGAGLTTSGSNLVPDFSTASTAGKVTQANDPRLPPTPTAAGKLIVDTGSGAYHEINACGTNTVLLGQGAADPTCGAVPNAALANSSITINAPSFMSSWGAVSLGSSLSPTWSNENANVVFAGPTSGGPTTPTWRALVAADIPSVSSGFTGVLPIANGGTNATATPTNGGVAAGTGTAYTFSAAGTAGQFLKSNGAAVPLWTSNWNDGLTTSGVLTALEPATIAPAAVSGGSTTLHVQPGADTALTTDANGFWLDYTGVTVTCAHGSCPNLLRAARITAPTYTNSSGTDTTGMVSSLSINSAPTCTGGLTCTNPVALRIGNGNVVFGDTSSSGAASNNTMLGLGIVPTYGVHILGNGERQQALAEASGVSITNNTSVGTRAIYYGVIEKDAAGNQTIGSFVKTLTANATPNNSVLFTMAAGAKTVDVVIYYDSGGRGAGSICTGLTASPCNDTNGSTSAYTFPTRNKTADDQGDGWIGGGSAPSAALSVGPGGGAKILALAEPLAALTVTRFGTNNGKANSYYYVCKDAAGAPMIKAPIGTDASGPTTLNLTGGANTGYETLTGIACPSGSATLDIVVSARASSPTSTGSIALGLPASTTTFDDVGIAASAYVDPTGNTTGTITVEIDAVATNELSPALFARNTTPSTSTITQQEITLLEGEAHAWKSNATAVDQKATGVLGFRGLTQTSAINSQFFMTFTDGVDTSATTPFTFSSAISTAANTPVFKVTGSNVTSSGVGGIIVQSASGAGGFGAGIELDASLSTGGARWDIFSTTSGSSVGGSHVVFYNNAYTWDFSNTGVLTFKNTSTAALVLDASGAVSHLMNVAQTVTAGGAGLAMSYSSGQGGNGSGATAGGAGGNSTFKSDAGGSATTTGGAVAGVGGTSTFAGGAGGLAATSVNGGGVGGDALLLGGAGGAQNAGFGVANAGHVRIRGGAGTGGGTNGDVYLADSSTVHVNIGASQQTVFTASSGLLTTYNSEATAGLGAAYERAAAQDVASLGSSTNIATLSSPVSGFYRVCESISAHTNDDTVVGDVTFTDAVTGVASTMTLIASVLLTHDSATAGFKGECKVIRASGGSSIVARMSTTSATSTKGTSTIERLN